MTALAASGWGQNRMPADANSWLVAAYKGSGGDWYGDQDKVQVIFFEVDDTVTTPLYFGVYDPGIDAADNTNITPNVGDMWYRVYGGTGAYSNATSRQLVYSSPTTALAGTLLSNLRVDTASSASYNDAWFWSPAILPSQGEHVGNKYIFKYVVVAARNPDDGLYVDGAADDFFNRYQVAISTSNLGDPPTLSTVRAFAYSLTVDLEGNVATGSEWNLYPFVPTGSNTAHFVRPESYDGDYRNQANATTSGFLWNLYRWNGTTESAALPINISDGEFNYPGVGWTGGGATGQAASAANGWTVSNSVYTGRTWRFEMLGGGETAGTEPNGVDIWATVDASNANLAVNNTINAGGGTALRIYAAPFVSPTADHVVLLPSSQSVASGATASVTVQILDSSGALVPEGRAIRIVATNGTSPVIDAVDSDQVVTTDSSGAITFSLTNTGPGIVTLTPYTDGTGGGANFGAGVDIGGTVTFVMSPAPTFSSYTNTTLTAGSSVVLPVMTLASNGGTQITAASDIRIRIPSGLDVAFDTTQTAPSLVTSLGSTGAVSATVSYRNYADSGAGNKIAVLDVTTSFDASRQLAIGLSNLSDNLGLTTTNTASSGYLEVSYDGGSTYTVLDDKLITVKPSNFTWKSSGTTSSWFTGTNWVGNVAPTSTAGTEYVIIPTSTTYPSLAAAESVDLASLTILSGATMTLGGTTSTLRVRTTLDNQGTLAIANNETLTLDTGNDTDSGTISYTATSGSRAIKNLSYYNLLINGTGGTFTLPGNITLYGSLNINAGTLDAGVQTLTIYGDFTRTGSFTPSSSTVIFAGTGDSTIAGATTFYILQCLTPGKLLELTASQTTVVTNTFTILGSSSSPVRLHGTAASAAITKATTNSVTYADISNVTINTLTAASSTLSGTTTGWSATTLRTWTGATSTVWTTTTNWSPNGAPGTTVNESVLIVPTANAPVLDTSTFANPLSNVTIASSAVLDIAGQTLALTGTFSNLGTMKLTGAQTLAFTNDTDSGLTQVVTGGAGLGGLTSFYNLEIVSGTHAEGTSLTVNGSLTVTGGTLTLGTGAVAVTGTLSTGASGTITVSGTPSSFAAGVLSLAGTWNNTAANSLTVAGSAAIAGTFATPANSSLTLTGAGSTLTATPTVGNITVNGATLTLGAALTASGNLAVTSGSLDVSASNFAVSVTGNVTGGGTLNARSGTFTFTGTAAQTAASFTYYNVVVSKTAGSLAMSNPTLNGWATGASKAFGVSFPSGGSSATAVVFDNTGTLTIGAGFTFTTGVTATVPSSVSLTGTIGSTNAVLNFASATGLSLGGDTTLSSGSATTTLGGTLNGNSHLLTLNTMGASSTFGGAVTALTGLTMNTGAAFTLGGAVTTTGALTLTSGTLALAGNTLSFATVSGAGSVTTTSGTITATGAGGTIASLTVTTGATVNGGATGVTVTVATYNASPAVTTTGVVGLPSGTLGALTVTSGALTLGAGATSATSTTVTAGTLTMGGNLTVSGLLSNAGTVAAAGNTLSFATVSGAGSVTTTNGTITATGAGGTIPTVTVTTGVTVNGGATGIVITNNVANAITTTGLVTLRGTAVTTLTVTSGTATLNGALTASGAVSNGGTLALAGNTLSFATVSGAGSVTTTSGTITATGAGGTIASLTVTTGVTVNGGATGVTVTAATYNASPAVTTTGVVGLPSGTLGALTVTSGALTLGAGATSATSTTVTAGTLTMGGNLTVSGLLSNAGTVAAAGNTLSFATVSGAGSVTTSGTITATGAGGTIASLTVTTGLTVNGGATGVTVTAATYNASPAVTTTGVVGLPSGTLGALTVTSGALTLGAGATSATSTTVTAGTLTMGGNLTVSGLLSNAGTVAAAGNTLSFATVSGAGSVTTTSGTITATGAGGTIASLTVTTGLAVNGGATGVTVTAATYNASPAVTTTGVVGLPSGTLGALTVTSGALTLGAGATSATSTTVTAGTLTMGGNLTVSGLLSNAGTVAAAGNTLSFATVSGAGSVTTTSGTITATGAGGTIASLTVTTGVAVNGGATGVTVTAATYNASPAVTTTGVVGLPSGTLGALAVTSGALTLGAGATSATSTTVTAGTLTMGGNLTVSGLLSNAGTVAAAGNTLSFATVSGAGSVTTSGTVTATGAGGTIASLTVTTGVAVNGGATGVTVTAATYNASPAVTTTGVVGLPSGTLGALTVTSGALTLGAGATSATSTTVTTGTLTMGGNLTVSGLLSNAGTVAAAGNTLSFATVSGAGSVTTTSGTITATGAGGTIASLTVTTGVTVNGGATGVTVTAATYNASPAVTTTGVVGLPSGTLGALTVTSGALSLGAGATSATSTTVTAGTLTMGGNLTVSGLLSNAGTVAAAGNTLSFATVSGAGSVTTTNGTITATGAGGTIPTVTVTTGVTVNGGATGIVITNNVANAITTTGLVTLRGTAVTTLTVTSGTATLNGALTASGAVSNGGTLALAGNTLSFATVSGAGSVTTTSGTITATGAGGTIASLTVTTGATVNGGATGVTVTAATYNASPAVTTTGVVGLPSGTLGALTVTSGALTLGAGATSATSTTVTAGTLTMGGNLTVSGLLSNAGTVAAAGNTLSFATVSGAGSVTTSGTITATGAGGTIASLTVTTGLAVNGGATGVTVTAATYNASPAVTTTGVVGLPTGTVGTLTIASGTLTLSGDITATGLVTVTGVLALTTRLVDASAAGITGAGTVSTTVGGTLTAFGTIGTLSASTSATLNGGAGLTVTNAVTGSPALTTTGSVTMGGTLGSLSTSGTFTLNSATVATSVSITGASTFSQAGFSLSGTTLNYGNGSPITFTNNAALIVSGITTVNVGSGNSVTLNNAADDWGTVAAVSVNNLTLVDTNAVILGTSTISGNLGVTAVGITQSGTGVAVTGTTNLASGTGVITLTTGTNSLTGAVTLSATGAISVTTAAALVLAQVTGGGGAVALTTTVGNLTVNGPVSTTTGAVTVASSAGTTYLNYPSASGAAVTTVNANMTFSNAVVLLQDTTITVVTPSTTTTTLQFSSTVDANAIGGQFLVASASNGANGRVFFLGAVGGIKALASLTANSGNTGTTRLQVGNVTTTGAQAYNGTVNINQVTSVMTTSNASVTFSTVINAFAAGTQGLAVTAGSGTISIGGAVGGTRSLASLSLTSSNITSAIIIQGVTTSGAQDYIGKVTLGAPATLSAGGNVGFTDTIDGSQPLVVTAGTNLISLGGAVGGGTPLTSLSLTSTNAAVNAITVRSVTTTSTQDYLGRVSLGAATVLTTSSAAVGFSSPVNGAQNLTLALGTGTATASSTIGATTPLASLSLSSGTLALAANAMTVTGNVDFSGGVVSGTGTISIRGNVNRSAGGFNMTGGAIVLDGSTGAQTLQLVGSTIAGLTSSNSSGTPTVTLSSNPTTWSANLVLTSGSFILGSNASLSILGAVSGSGTATLDSSLVTTGTIAVGGAVGVTGTVLAPTSSGVLTVVGNFNVGTLTAPSGTVVLNGSGPQTLTTNGQAFQNLTLNTGTKVVTVSGALAVNGNLEVASGQTLQLATNNVALTVSGTTNAVAQNAGTIIGGTSALVFTGAFEIGTLTEGTGGSSFAGSTVKFHTFTKSTEVVTFNGAANQTVTTSGVNFNSVTLSTGTKSVILASGGALNVDGNLEVQANQTLNLATNNVAATVLGTTNAVAGTTGTIAAGSGALVFTGDFRVGSLTESSTTTSFGGSTVTFSTFVANAGGQVRFSRAGAQAWTPNGATLTSLTLTAASTAVTTAGSFGVGTLSLTTGTLTVSASDTATVSTSTSVTGGHLYLNGPFAGGASFSLTSPGQVDVGNNSFAAGAFTQTSGTFVQTGANSSQTVTSLSVAAGTMDWDNNNNFGTLVIDGPLSNSVGTSLNFHQKDVRINGTITGALTLYDLYILSGKTLTLSSPLTVLRNVTIENGGTYVHGAQTLTLGSGGASTTGTILDQNASPQNLGAVVLAGTAGTVKTLGSATLTNSLSIPTNTTLALATFNLTVGGGVTGAGTLTATGSQTIAVGGDFQVGTYTRGTGETLVLNGTAAANVNAYALTNLQFNKTNTVTSLGALTVNGTLTMTQGTWVAGAFTHSIAGNWDSTGITLTATGSTINLTSAASVTQGAQAFNNLGVRVGGSLLTNLNVGGNLVVGAGTPGTLTDGGNSLTVTGTTTVTAGANSVLWTNAANNFTGAVSVTNSGANNVSVRDTNALVLGAFSVGTGTLTVQSGGNLTQTGTLVQAASAGTASFTAGAALITLTLANDFTGPVALSNSGANNVAVTDTNSLTLGTVGVGTGSLTLTAGGSIAQATGTAITQGTSGNVVLSATGAISLDELGGSSNFIYNLGTVTRGGAFVLRSHANLSLNGAVGSNASAVTISTTGTLAVGATVTTTGANNISLTGTGVSSSAAVNAGSGTITVDGGASTINLGSTFTTTSASASAVRVRNATSVALPAVTAASGTLEVGVGSDVTGDVTQNGALSASVLTLSLGGTAKATLNGANTFTNLGAVATNGAVQLTTSGAPVVTGTVNTTSNFLTLNTAGLSITTGSLNVGTSTVLLNSTGAVTQTGIITASGLQLRGSGSFTLNQANQVDSVASAATAGAVSVTSANAGGAAIASVTTDGVTTANVTNTNQPFALTTTAGPITVTASVSTGSGIVTFTTSSGTTTQASSIVTSGGLRLLGTGTYTLTHTSNNLAVLAGSLTGSASVYASTLTSIGSLSGTNGWTSTGNLTLDGPLGWTQAATRVILAPGLELKGSGPYTFVEANAVTTLAAAVTGDVTYTDTNALVLGPVNTAGFSAANATLVVAGAGLSQTGDVVVPGLLTVTAGTSPIDLNFDTNNFSTVAIPTVAALILDDTDGYTLRNVTTTGTADVSTKNSGDLTIASTFTLTFSGAGPHTLHPAGNLIILGQVATTLGAVDLNPAGQTTLQPSTNPVVRSTGSGGNLVFSRPVVLAADSTVTATSNAVTFAAASTVNGTFDLTVNRGTGQVTFNGAVGGSFPLDVLTVSGSTGTGVNFVQAVSASSVAVTGGGAVLVQGTTTTPSGFSSAGTSFSNTGTITTTGTALTINHTATISIGAALASGAGAVTVNSGTGTTVSAAGTVTTTTGNVQFGNTGAGALTTAGNITTGGGTILWNRASSLSGAVTLTSGGGAVTIASTLDGNAQSLTINAGAAGAVLFSAAVDDVALFTLTNSNGLTASNTWGVSAPGNVTITATTTGQTVDFQGTQTNITTLDADAGAYQLRIAGSATASTISTAAFDLTGTLTLGGAAGADITVSGGIVHSAGPTTLRGTISSGSNDQTYDAVTLGAATTLNAGTAKLYGAVAGGSNAFAINGNAEFGNAGADTVTGVSTLDVTGTALVRTTTITSTGNQTYGNAVTLAANVVFTANSGSLVRFQNAVTGTPGPRSLTVTTANVQFDGSVSGNLSTISIAGSAALNGAVVTTSSTQTYAGTVTLGADTTLTASAVAFNGQVVGAASDLAVVGNATFGNAAGDTMTGVAVLTVSGTTTINTTTVTTTGNQTYTGAVTLGNDVTFTSNAGSVVRFANLVSGVTTARALTVNTANVRFDGAVSGNISTVSIAGSSALNGAVVTTSSTQTYSGSATLGANTTLTASSVTFGNTVVGATRNLAVVGNVTFGNSAGDTVTGVAVLSVSGTTAINTTTVTTTGNQTYTGAVTLGVSTTVSSGASVSLGNNLSGLFDLTLGASTTAFSVAGLVNIGDGTGASFTAPTGVGTILFQGTVTTANNLTVGSSVTAEFQSDVSIAGTGTTTFGTLGTVNFTKPTAQTFATNGDVTFSGSANGSAAMLTLGPLTPTTLKTISVPGTLTVGSGGVTVNANFTSSGTVNGSSGADLVYTTPGSPTTVTWSTYSPNNGRTVFNAAETITLIPNDQGVDNALVGNGLATTLHITDGHLVVRAGKTFTVSSNSFFLFWSTSAYSGTRRGVELQSAAQVVNNGIFRALEPGAAGTSQVFVWGSGATAGTLQNNNSAAGTFLFPTGSAPDVSLGKVTVTGSTPTVALPLTGQTLWLEDSGVQLVNLSLTTGTTLDFRGLVSTLTAHDLKVSGNWTSVAGSTLANKTTATPSASTVTFNNTGAVTLTLGSVAPTQQLQNVILAGSGSDSLLLGADTALAGSLTQNAGSLFNLSSRTLLVGGGVAISATAASDFVSAGSTVSLEGAGTLSSTQPFHNLFLNAPGGTVNQGSAITVGHRLAAFRGTWNTNAFALNITEDFVAYGTGYVNYTVGGTTYHPADDGELAATRSATYYENKLGYPYWAGAGPGQSGGAGTALNIDAATGYSSLATVAFTASHSVWSAVSTTYATPSYANVTAGAMAAAFNVNQAVTITVGKNFYNFGASMTGVGPGVWNLALPAKWTAVTLNANKDNDWFGYPFAVALATGPGMSVSLSSANQRVAAAQTSAGGTHTAGTGVVSPVWTSAVSITSTTLWDNTQPDFDTVVPAATRFDNLVEVTFTEAMRNQFDETASVLGSQASLLDNLLFMTGVTRAGTRFDFTEGTAGNAGEYNTSALAAGTNPAVISFRTLDTESLPTWNTDATGSSVGASGSTDRSGNARFGSGAKPDLQIEKGRLYDQSGNPLVNHDTLNFNAVAGVSTRYTATVDHARPVLTKVELGQAVKNIPAATQEDGHNYWHLTWSEPVNLDATAVPGINAGGTLGSLPSATAAGGNLAAALAFGDSYTDDTGIPDTIQLTGLAQYAGHLYRGSRSQNQADPRIAQVDAAKTSNSLARSSAGNDLFIYLAGSATGTGDATDWDGFWWEDVPPTINAEGVPPTVNPAYVNAVNQAVSVDPAYTTQVTDRSAALNPVENTHVVWAASGSSSDPKPSLVVANASATKWEIEPPIFARSTDTPDSYEVIALDKTFVDDKVDQVQIHLLSNLINSGQTRASWDSVLDHPDGAPTHFGVRDTSLSSVQAGFSLKVTPGTGAFENHFTGAGTAVDNPQFNGLPAVAVNVKNDGYFTLTMTAIDAFKPSLTYLFHYDAFQGMATNLAGRLLDSTPAGGLKALDRTPPYVTLTLAANQGNKVYVQFSRQVVATPTDGNLGNLKYVLSLSGTSNGNSIDSMEILNPTGVGTSINTPEFQEALLTLSAPLLPQDFATAKISAIPHASSNGNSTITKSRNSMDTSILYPISSLGIDLVQPVWASDGVGGEANSTGTARVIHAFDGSEALTPRDITLQGKVFGGAAFTSLPLRLFYDLNVPSGVVTNGLWLPTGIFEPSGVTEKVPSKDNPAARALTPTATNPDGSLKTFVVPGSDTEMKTGSELQFIFRVGTLYAVRGVDTADPRQLGVYRIPLKGIKEQKNGVTILNNVIDPTQGQRTEILYSMKRAGVVTAQVFALDGSLVRILHRGRQAAGDYSLLWDGKNEGGNIVARGVYFIRVVAPDIDETRNVLVIK